jgi:hypothetical protein
MSKFIGYTVGLECNGRGKVARFLKVEYSRANNGGVILSAVSGHDLSSANIRTVLTAEQFENRPTDPYDSIIEARWALKRLGFSLSSDVAEE